MTDIPMRELCDSLAAGILKICEANNTKIACAESLTGGLLADAFVRIPGASNVLLGSAVTYDINAKASILHVDKALLDREGAVHPEVARQMAIGTARLYSQPEYGDRIISLTADHAEVLKAVELHLDGMREEVRRLTVFHVLQNLSLFTASFKE